MSTEAVPKPPLAFSFRAFSIGMAGVLGLGLVLAIYLWLNATATIAARSQKLASQTVLIKYEEPVLSGAEPQPEMYGPYLAVPDHAAQPDTDTATVIESPVETIQNPPQPDEETGTTEPDLNEGLARAPVDGLFEDTKDGRLPKIRSQDKLTPFDAYRRPFAAPAGKPVISVAIVGAGISSTATENIIESLPPEITVVVDPYSINPEFWMNEARADGHEVWLKLPVETNLYPLHDPGPQTLLVNGLERQNLNKLNWVLSRGVGYAGIATGYDAAFTKAPNALRPVINAIYSRGLGFIDGDIQPGETAGTISESLNRPYAHNNVWIDIPATAEHVAASLRQLEVLAEGQGSATGFVHVTPMAMEMLAKWIETLDEKGFALAPLSAQADPAR